MQHRPSEGTEPVTTTADHADMRGLGTTLLVSVECLPQSRREGLSQPRNANEGCTITGAASLPRIGIAHVHPWGQVPGRLRGRGLGLGDRPHEGGEFAGDGGRHGIGMLAPRKLSSRMRQSASEICERCEIRGQACSQRTPTLTGRGERMRSQPAAQLPC